MELIVLVIIGAFFLYLIVVASAGSKREEPFEGPHCIKAQSEYLVRPLIPTLPEFYVSHIIDGDTVDLSIGRREFRVRLDSIDCPEDGQHWGDTAKYGLIKMIGGRKVHLEKHGVDFHGRTLGTLYVWNGAKNEWLNVNERMVTLGHAWVMRLYYGHLPQDRKDKFNRLENWAKSKRVGMWGTESPMPPWQWRKEDEC